MAENETERARNTLEQVDATPKGAPAETPAPQSPDVANADVQVDEPLKVVADAPVPATQPASKAELMREGRIDTPLEDQQAAVAAASARRLNPDPARLDTPETRMPAEIAADDAIRNVGQATDAPEMSLRDRITRIAQHPGYEEVGQAMAMVLDQVERLEGRVADFTRDNTGKPEKPELE